MSIDILVVNALLDSFMRVLANMANIELKTGLPTGEPTPKTSTVALGDVSGIIPLNSVEIDGSMAISFSKPVILDLAKRMLGEEFDSIDDTIKDLTGEITNMIAGGTKRVLSEHGYDIDMATPKVIAGVNHDIIHHVGDTTIIIPFHLESGDVYMEINFDRGLQVQVD